MDRRPRKRQRLGWDVAPLPLWHLALLHTQILVSQNIHMLNYLGCRDFLILRVSH
ncbi:hypothetical protein DCAR_0933979 [Daucus carota subsp. sativus]|uniref:Uncharacterized protein n=1 Tax=Daucus carota subsp. sativus TaxID=79200 RepID=A0A175YE10_DAUCS|nr:hypothetical protein DCAR_0933979 [Daucus carota subsp. sativus]